MRFRLLADLCYALGERGCGSMLLRPRHGEVVLYVPYLDRPQARLGVAAVEDRGRWMFTYGGEVSLSERLEETVLRIIAMVTAR
ncbi:hypothetical protein ACFQ07_02045 [Actinomadura adrarensis]|uniref:DUF5753 domain-containing protein n=1 Tax=Actinomadura adrarensis TaxID=1819600 RepID=A0ABW3C902_9ACTN